VSLLHSVIYGIRHTGEIIVGRWALSKVPENLLHVRRPFNVSGHRTERKAALLTLTDAIKGEETVVPGVVLLTRNCYIGFRIFSLVYVLVSLLWCNHVTMFGII